MPTVAEARKIAEELEAFRRSAVRFSESKPNLIEKYHDRWVAVFGGEVIADAASIGELIETLKKQGKPLTQIMIRHMTKEPRRFIL